MFWTCWSVAVALMCRFSVVDGEDMFGFNSSQANANSPDDRFFPIFSLCPHLLPSSSSLLGICHAMSSGIYTANLPIAPLTEGRLVA